MFTASQTEYAIICPLPHYAERPSEQVRGFTHGAPQPGEPVTTRECVITSISSQYYRMPLIEGVGDEVVQFAGVVLVVVVAALAWWSTNARPDRYRTVLVMRSRAHHPVTVNIRSRPNLMVTSAQDNNSSTPPVSETLVASPPESVEESRESARVIPLQEMDSIVDADVAMLDNHRLHFYRRIDSAPSGTQSVAESSSDEGTAVEEVEPASTAQIREMDSIVSAMEADVNTTSPIPETKDKTEQNKSDDKPSASNVNSASETINNVTTPEQNVGGDSSAKKILIKLKYLNDTLKEVEGSLDELLKDFKWRHFSTELSGECRVRLIFNGRVLADEAATLRALGLHHRAVVHALVHPKRQGNQGPVASTEGAIGIGARAELVAEGGAGGGRRALVGPREHPHDARLHHAHHSLVLQMRVLEHVHSQRERGAVRADGVLQRRHLRPLPLRHLPHRPTPHPPARCHPRCGPRRHHTLR
ncbi:hypothetical protein O0L34_g17167 [Tuta absoluta]|nr:hypothetical protein O0L34_g17167 [Tuta absoluta]